MMDDLTHSNYPNTIRMDETLGDILARANIPSGKTGIAILDEVSNIFYYLYLKFYT